MLEDLTEDMCELIRSNSGRNFTNRAIKEIAKAVLEVRTVVKLFFIISKALLHILVKY